MAGETWVNKSYLKKVPANMVIFEEKNEGTEMYIVLEGLVDITTDSGGKTIPLAQITKGGFFGEMSLLEGQPRAATALASIESTLMVLTAENFNQIISQNPDIALSIMKGLSGRIRKLNNRVKELSFKEKSSAEEKAKYFLNREIICPVCENKSQVVTIKESKLRQSGRTDELRITYEDINPLLYNIWVCPNCYYAMFRNVFEKINGIQKTNLEKQTVERKGMFNLDFSSDRSVDSAIASCKVALKCCEVMGANKMDAIAAGLWLQIAWLYDDTQNSDKALFARREALENYTNAYSRGTVSPENEDKLVYRLGKLSMSVGNLKEARVFLFRLISKGSTDKDAYITNMARELLEQLKSS